MLFDIAEIELMRLAGWLKGLPLTLCNFNTQLLSPAGIESLCYYRLLHITQSGRQLRLTPSGWDLLSNIGYSYPQDSKYISDSVKVARRNEAAKILFTFYRAELDVFADSPEELKNPSIYLSSAAARRNTEYRTTKVWGGCRLAGIGKLQNSAYMIHFIGEQGMYFSSEMELFHKLVANRSQSTACIFAADSYMNAAHWIINQPPPSDKKRSGGWISFRDACKMTKLPLHLLECSDNGALQLQIMNTPDYRSTIAKLALAGSYKPPHKELPDTDALSNNPSLPMVTAVDMDVKRIGRAYRTARSLGFQKLLVVALPEQLDTLAKLFASTNMMEFYQIPTDNLMPAMGLKLYDPPREVYRTKKGELLYASDIPPRRKAGRPPAKKTGQVD